MTAEATTAIRRTRPRNSLSFLRAAVPVAWVEIAVIVGVNLLVRRVDPDFWWHLATGNAILDDGIPRSDAYSWTARGEPWIAHEWASEAIIALVQRTAGYGGNVLLFAACVVGSMLIMYALGARLGAGSRGLILSILMSAFMLILFIAVRPMIFTWLLFSVTLFILSRHERSDSRELWVLPPLMLIWANLHLGFAVGLGLVGIWIASRLYRRMRGEQVTLAVPLIIGALCAGATLVNPSGWDVLLYQFENRGRLDSLSTLVLEWRSPVTFFSLVLIPYYLGAAILLISLALPRRPSLFLGLVGVAMVVLSLTAVRHIPFVALSLIPIAGLAFTGRSPEGAPGRKPTTMPASLAFAVLVAAFLIAAQVSGGWSSLDEPSGDSYPQGGASWIAENKPEARLYNQYLWGGYLIYQHPETPVFIDGRTDVYWSGVFDDYMTIISLNDGWQALINGYGIDTVLIRKRSALASSLRRSDAWEEVFTGSVESVFVRR